MFCSEVTAVSGKKTCGDRETIVVIETSDVSFI